MGYLKGNVAFLIMVFLILFIFEVDHVVSGSMEPTLMTGDYAIFTKVRFGYKPNRGDIIGFNHDGEHWVKRVIGIPGDMIVIKDMYVYVNGEKIDEPYLENVGITYGGDNTIFAVPEDEIFVLGDNRLASYDSRYWNEPYVPVSYVTSKYRFTIYHAKTKATTFEEEIL
ncbi:signal peptidase I [Butyrivibrio proteoclasticus]|nr:signal peptidase I [Butyrivibrio proteoclasticus]